MIYLIEKELFKIDVTRNYLYNLYIYHIISDDLMLDSKAPTVYIFRIRTDLKMQVNFYMHAVLYNVL